MKTPPLRRFYRMTGIARDADGRWRVRLDDKRLASPAGRDFPLPSEALAAAIAAEWAAQGERIRPADLPLMGLAATAIDHLPQKREIVLAELVAYAETDLLRQRAEAPPELVRRQQAAWDPILAWVESRYDVALPAVSGIRPPATSPQTIAHLRRAISAYDDFRLMGLDALTRNLGSLCLALALAEGRIDGPAAIAAAQLEESFQAESWGRDAEAENRRAAESEDIRIVLRFLGLLGEGAKAMADDRGERAE